ncbi:MAG: tRNA uridine(34) 5-carboxymethylaminomethyl modification radical SAM/GNAT enzyme Elp3 [Chloroflexi bacterium]|nr:MAG: tRNA uridine(34) 5-carboxymethylaminomethyl modification radical SAM/GNAT enzyme Elp3 [Chloroflexota bacterium]MBL1194384.1 tRNA uridine(34) 5-carboxymethylaminomethyl modification radical SAM/GNAT enzyme Elp3 [Chloroflexota bacterium]NOH11672.1 tRNA uridine(34) 5-carboxymethylaminomethyl modification radical SAM/GNAT enzyme Elp3 [Chloroflexota bacterium]
MIPKDLPIQAQTEDWYALKRLTPEKLDLALEILEEVRAGESVMDAMRHHPLQGPGGGFVAKSVLVTVYREMVENGAWDEDPDLLAAIRMKPMRTLSGVTVVTVLTKPYPCPGKCIFCPTDVRMPKSYLPDEPGAMRALHHDFDPYDQVAARIQALESVGHPTDKIELLILGGTWSSYTRDYQEWFVKRLFEAMNEVESETLAEAQELNETTAHRNVGLVIETRPDHVDPDELAWLRYLGVTKVQMGAQSFDDHILDINKRGHDVESTRQATALLRAAGFKIVLHWMPNLMGATPESDRLDFAKMWQGFCPDEIKIYPNQLLENAELYEYWQRGEFEPYSTQDLIDLICDIKPSIPRYCRVNRVIRDIPSNNVVEGNKRTSLRMDVHAEMKRRGTQCNCVRCREVRGRSVEPEDLHFEDLSYQADGAEEHFLQFVTPNDRLAGFLRLSLPQSDSPETGLNDLDKAAIIREVHVYGQSIEVGDEQSGAAQHIGLGTKLIEQAEALARDNGFEHLAVIAAVGTRKYYAGRGFKLGHLYMKKEVFA